MADTPIPPARAKDISQTAKKILPILKYNLGDLKYLNGTSSSDPQMQTRLFQAGEARIRVTDFQDGRTSVHVENGGDITHVEYNRTRQALLTIKKAPDRALPEALATHFATGKELSGHDAVSSVVSGGPDGVDPYPGYAAKASLDTKERHDLLVEAVKPATPVPQPSPKDGKTRKAGLDLRG